MIMKRCMFILLIGLVAADVARAEVIDFTFAVWSDLHFGAYDEAGYRDDAAADIVNLPGTPYPPAFGGSVDDVSFVMIPGDISENSYFSQWHNDNGATNDDFVSCINRFFPPAHVFEITGNHDSWNEPGATMIRNAIAARHGGTSYSFDFGGVHFVGLDGGPDDMNPFGPGALDWLEAHMPTLSTDQAVIIYSHYQGRDNHADWDRFYEAVRDYNVILHCVGHHHIPRVERWRGIDVLVTSDTKVVHGNQAFSVVRITDTQLTAVPYDWYNNAWRSDITLTKTITGVGRSFAPAVTNPSFEARDGSLEGWQITRTDGVGPDNPPHDTGTYDVTAPHGDHFAGKITNWGQMDFTMGQTIEVTGVDPNRPAVAWSLTAMAQMRSATGSTPFPGNVHQTWEIGWNSDGSFCNSIDTCDGYLAVADIDGGFTDNDATRFSPLTADGQITDLPGLRYLTFRVRFHNDTAREWTLNNIDAVGFGAKAVSIVPEIAVEPTAIEVSTWIGTPSAPDRFTVRNAGPDTLNYTVNTDVDWITPEPGSGVSTGQADPIELEYANVPAMRAGVYTAQITVTSPDAWNDPVVVPVTLTIETVGPDLDGDADVDQEDFGYFQACYGGPGIAQTLPACLSARLDGDDDVDSDDLVVYRRCMSGANLAANPNCAK